MLLQRIEQTKFSYMRMMCAFLVSDPAAGILLYYVSAIITYPNVIALEEAGYSNVKLYSGSWSDWISYEENTVATGEE